MSKAIPNILLDHLLRPLHIILKIWLFINYSLKLRGLHQLVSYVKAFYTNQIVASTALKRN